ncbi:GNAT family N-acetyltransferase [Sediminibacillus albus]|uniref:N-acetyltransferase domain-containing protein n=1 Tax=Sediminibacillus albus TaxID=407036 RepID=A0A1G8ZPW1_9BACI|nr:GNAT family N-acetyltransferase [Sediminibacillus albus]SDK17087.1 hypothetical protein SAMN05216243_2152 [Sediminibacillus albus]
MEIILSSSINSYFQEAEPLLLKREACNNLALGILTRLKEDPAGSFEAAPYLGLVKHRGVVEYLFLQTPPNNLILPNVENTSHKTIEAVAEYLFKQGIKLPGVLGPKQAAQVFAQKWEALTGGTAIVQMNQLIYRLDKVYSINTVNGEIGKADSSYLPLITDWLRKFGEEADIDINLEAAEKMAADFINKRSVYVWLVDGTPVSMANQSRKTKHGVTVNAVYTPDEYKRKGYATALVSAFSKLLLQEGNDFCSLYTDQANITANSIYKKIGYQEVGESIMYRFK